MEMLRIRDLNDFRKLQPNKWKIRQFGNEIAELAQRENGQFYSVKEVEVFNLT